MTGEEEEEKASVFLFCVFRLGAWMEPRTRCRAQLFLCENVKILPSRNLSPFGCSASPALKDDFAKPDPTTLYARFLEPISDGSSWTVVRFAVCSPFASMVQFFRYLHFWRTRCACRGPRFFPFEVESVGGETWRRRWSTGASSRLIGTCGRVAPPHAGDAVRGAREPSRCTADASLGLFVRRQRARRQAPPDRKRRFAPAASTSPPRLRRLVPSRSRAT